MEENNYKIYNVSEGVYYENKLISCYFIMVVFIINLIILYIGQYILIKHSCSSMLTVRGVMN